MEYERHVTRLDIQFLSQLRRCINNRNYRSVDSSAATALRDCSPSGLAACPTLP
ncbi:MAG: hypothetical protein JWL71_1378 [Acidobacteria bacterium]|nr:hypothetical protein [Acidobacteriota bacterium]